MNSEGREEARLREEERREAVRAERENEDRQARQRRVAQGNANMNDVVAVMMDVNQRLVAVERRVTLIDTCVARIDARTARADRRSAHVSSIQDHDFNVLQACEHVAGYMMRTTDNGNIYVGPTIEQAGDDELVDGFTWGEPQDEDAHIDEFYAIVNRAIADSLPTNYFMYNVHFNRDVNMHYEVQDYDENITLTISGRTDFIVTLGQEDQRLDPGHLARVKVFVEVKTEEQFAERSSAKQAVTELLLANRLSHSAVTVALTSGFRWRFYQLDQVQVVGGEMEWWALYENVEGWAAGIRRLRHLVNSPPAVNRYRQARQGRGGGGGNGGGGNGGGRGHDAVGGNGAGDAGNGPGARADNDDEGRRNRGVGDDNGGGGGDADINAALSQPESDDEDIDLDWEHACAVYAVNQMPMFQAVC